MAELSYTIQSNELVAAGLKDFVSALPSDAKITVETENRNIGVYSDDHEDFTIFTASF